MKHSLSGVRFLSFLLGLIPEWCSKWFPNFLFFKGSILWLHLYITTLKKARYSSKFGQYHWEKSICTVNSSDMSSRLWQKRKEPGSFAEKIPENLLLYVLCLSSFKKYLLYLIIGIKICFFQKKLQEDIFQQPHHTRAHIPEPLLYLLLWGTLHWDGGTGRWTGETAKAASQLKWKHDFNEEAEGISWLKNTSHHKNQNKGIKNMNFSIILFWELCRSCNYLRKCYSVQQVTDSEISSYSIKCKTGLILCTTPLHFTSITRSMCKLPF